MNQTEARQLAHQLQTAGLPVIADSGGGWSGGPRSQIWGIRNPNLPPTLSKLYITRDGLPPSWRDKLPKDAS